MTHLFRPASILCVVVSLLSASVRVTESTARRLTFTWELDDYRQTELMVDGRRATSLSFGGGNIILGEDGEPVIPGYSVYAGVPPRGEVRVSFVAEQVRTVQLRSPLITHKLPGRFPRQPDISFAQTWVSEPRYTRLRRYRACHLIVRPFSYDRAGGTLRVLLKGQCTIEFPSSTQPLLTRQAARSDAERMFERTLLNPDLAATWAQPPRALRKRAADLYPLSFDQPRAMFKIGDGHKGGAETTTEENGIVRIPGSKVIEALGATTIAVRDVALFGSYKGEQPETTPDSGKIPAGIAPIPLLRFDLNSNGRVDPQDYFLAYVTGSSDWAFDTVEGDFSFRLNRYDDYRRYYIAIAPGQTRDIDTFPKLAIAGDTTDVVVNRYMFKESRLQPSDNSEGSLDWVWAKMTPVNTPFSYTLGIPGAAAGDSGSIRFSMGSSSGGATIRATIDGEKVCDSCQPYESYPVKALGTRRVSIDLQSAGESKTYYELKHLDVRHVKRLSASSANLALRAFSSVDTATTHYRLSDLDTGLVYILRVSADQNNVHLIDTVRGSASQTTYVWSDSAKSGALYLIYRAGGFLEMPELTPVSFASDQGLIRRDLRKTTASTDFLIVSGSAFLQQAEELALHKTKVGFSAPCVVDIADIYNQFAGGNVDPAAIRNFVSYVVRNWNRGDMLDYLILFGRGHYDYKQISTSEVNHIPVALLWDKAVEDFFAYVNPGDISFTYEPQLAVGRLPCANAAEAKAVVQKIVAMEDPASGDFGAWRNRMLHVADDDMQGPNVDPIVSTSPHHGSAEKVADISEKQWPTIDTRKVYLYEYEWNELFEKPEASRAIINEITNGIAYVNYFGHGSDNVWADEHILTPDNVNSMLNPSRYPLVSSFSCSVGRFDKPDAECLSDVLVRASGGGAIAAISSTRLAYANSNEDLAVSFYQSLFDTIENRSIGSAYITAKALNHNESQRSYSLLGDPSIKHVNFVRRVDLQVLDMAGVPDDTLMALQQVRVRGRVLDKSGALDATFGATEPAYVHLALFNAPDSASRKDGGTANDVRYLLPGKPLFAGKAAVRGGVFEQTMLLPRNLSFERSGVKLTAYAWQKTVAGLGYKSNIIFKGTDPNQSLVNDTTGPRITIRPVYEEPSMTASRASFTGRITSILPFKCELDIHDQSGIDVVGVGPDEGLTMEIENRLSKRNINHKFQFVEGDYRRGSATLAFEENSLSPGTHRMTVSAQDLLGNISRVTFELEIVDDSQLRLDRVVNYPNPMRMGETTTFYFLHSNAAYGWNPFRVTATIKIYSMTGKLLRVIRNAQGTCVWDGKDQAGRLLSPNVYLYRVEALSPDHDLWNAKSKLMKLVIHPPRK